MVSTSPAVVIDNGSYTTKAGFALEDLPSLVFNSNYLINTSDGAKAVIGDDEILAEPENEVMTLMENGLIYNYDHIIDNWNYVYENIDNNNSINPKEFPLVITEQTWNTSKNKLAATQIVFETLEVPLFSLVKTPLAQLYHTGKATGLVVDIGSAVASVTPILDGIIQSKVSFHTKYAGDFVNLSILNHLEKFGTLEDFLPAKYHSASSSFKNFYASRNLIQEFKVASTPEYQFHKGIQVKSNGVDFFSSLFQPQLLNVPNVNIPEPVLDKPQTHGLVNLIFHSLKSLEASIVQSGGQNSSRFARFNEILKTLLANIVITGGSSLATGLSDRILNDVRAYAALYFPNYGFNPYYIQTISNYQAGDVNDTWNRLLGGWLGASNLAGMLNDTGEETNGVNIALDNWFVSKSDYEELGEDLILEKFK
ncbi:uncharacterized protein PRCAT00000630001 [Priceomyces carsonii]|uniref:uncharacterized protein n=1 Tax=Priceomyces carsonii TaxID=28549 RepID=UPI002ED97B36|nr:unnamed protein product [Priceomyces carsonii]